MIPAIQVKSADLQPPEIQDSTGSKGLRGLFSSLSREQKESIGLLQIGTFFEMFDLMLYVHMAVILNELFFPQTDAYSASLLAAAAFCSTFVFRPLGALIFGWIGDNIGRKSTITITTAMTAISCIVMANLPTYAQIGIAAAWVVTICRIMQGMASMGERVGAEIYLTESIRRPASYPAIASLTIPGSLGGFAALGVATLVTSSFFNWRLAFWIGTAIALVSAIARIRLRETPEFLEMKRKWLKKEIHEMNLENDPLHGAAINATWKEPVEIRTLISYFLISCGWPLCFYLIFLYFNPILKESFGYSPEEIIRHNFFLSIILVISNVLLTYLSCRIHPIKILKIIGTLSLLLMIALPFLIVNLTNPVQLFLIQGLGLLLILGPTPADAIFLNHFPLYRRFTFASFLFSASRAIMFIITSFGLVYLGSYFSHFGLWFITLPIAMAYLYGVHHFEGLERKQGIYPNLSRT